MIYKLASKQTWIAEIEAATEAEAVKKAAEKFKLYTPKLMAVRRDVMVKRKSAHAAHAGDHRQRQMSRVASTRW
jgi:hypothetical protein